MRLIIAAVFLFTPCKLLALTGLTDPGLWLFLRAVFYEIREKRKGTDK